MVAILIVLATIVATGTWLLTANVIPGWLARRRVAANLRRGYKPVPTVGGTADGKNPGSLVGWSARIVPAPIQRNLDRLVEKAGRPASYTFERVLVMKLLGPLAGVFLLVLMPILTPGILGWIGGLIGLALGLFAPEALLMSKETERKKDIVKELPDLLDQMVIAVSAGIGFEGAMDHASKGSSGPLADEMRRCIQAVQIGLPRRDAYEQMAARCAVPEVTRFVRAVNRASEHGIPLSDVLNQQASLMRMQRRQKAEAAAAKIPTKVVFPTILLIMPVLIVIIMAPPLLRIGHEVMHWF